jgi:deoxyribose-phosphate aldolase
MAGDLTSLKQLVETKIAQIMSIAAQPADTSTRISADRLAAMIDHTLLKAEATTEQIAALCRQALEYRFAAVCVNSAHIPQCHALLDGTGIQIACVVGFPLGASLSEVKGYEAQRAIAAGATEVDMVIQVGAVKERAYGLVHRDIAVVAQACHARGAVLKTIIEAALLTDEEKIAACSIAQVAGSDMVKTSTGFGPGGATQHDVALMRRTVGPTMGIKAAGGIRTYQDALVMVQAGATRIGASAGIAIVQQARAEEAQ